MAEGKSTKADTSWLWLSDSGSRLRFRLNKLDRSAPANEDKMVRLQYKMTMIANWERHLTVCYFSLSSLASS
jgi:hypothetical protein